VTLIGVAEKGYATLRVTAKAAGGHSSAPPKDTGAVTLSRAVIAINDHAFPVKFQGPFAQMLKTLAPQLPFVAKMAVANDWLFGPLLAAQASATPQGAAGLHTTTAPTMLQGSPKENVLPTTSIARINYRILPGDTTDMVMARAKAAVGKLPVELSFERMASNPSPVSSTQSEAYKTIAALAGEMSGAPVAPSLVTGATDSRHMIEVAKDVYRFQPIRFSMHDIEMIHGINEHMTLTNLEAMVQFYRRLVVKTAG
jgi:carboxypeptidase PM20D1